MKKLFTIAAALFALALIGCEDPSDEMFSEIEKQDIEIFEDNIVHTEQQDKEIELP